MNSNTAPRILICRLSAVGDCILTTPMLCALREQFPKAFLAWAVEPAAAPLLENHPALDRLIVVDKRWLKSWQKIRFVRKELRALKFDVAIDPQSLSKSAMLAWLSGAKQRIGFQTPRGKELSLWLNNHFIKQSARHLVDCQLELLQALGVDSPRAQFCLPTSPSAEEKATGFLHCAHLTGSYVVMNPGAGWDSRLWPADRYGRVARALGKHHQIPTLVAWAGDHERVWAEQILTHSGGHAVLAPVTSLPELATLLRRARLFLGSDTGPLHLASAVGTTCVGLHGTTRYQDSGAYGPQHISIQDHYQAGTSRARRRASNDAMRAIEVDRVVKACEEVLARPVDQSSQDAA